MRRFKHEPYWRQSRQYDKKTEKIKTDLPNPKPFIRFYSKWIMDPEPGDMIRIYMIQTGTPIDSDVLYEELNKVQPGSTVWTLTPREEGHNHLAVIMDTRRRWEHIVRDSRKIIEAILLDDSG